MPRVSNSYGVLEVKGKQNDSEASSYYYSFKHQQLARQVCRLAKFRSC